MTDPVSAWMRLPEELRWARQWVVAGPDKSPYTANAAGSLYRASVTDPSTWLDFDTACRLAVAHGAGIGYVLHESDAYTCIDLDVKDAENAPNKPETWTTPEQLTRYWSICQGLDSYTEKSRSGKGLHIWVRGNIGVGRRRGGVEVYSRERFIICTGDVVLARPIQERQEALDQFVDELKRLNRLEGVTEGVVADQEDMHDDADIIARAMSAANADKFLALCKCTGDTGDGDEKEQGSYTELGYPSQSEADLALMSMFTFYSRSNEQCKRLFRMSGLGKRAKANRDDKYLDRTILGRRKAQFQEEQAAKHGEQLSMEIVARAAVEKLQAASDAARGAAGDSGPQGQSPAAAVATMAPRAQAPYSGLAWPPGFAGALANFIYQSSPRPVQEVSIVAALGMLAGICGRTWLLPQSGLNMYIILVARSAIGKEAMHSGISILLNKLQSSMPQAHQFVDFSDFASGPALQKAVAANPCFVNVAGEWGKKLRKLANDGPGDGPMQSLRTVMTNLYQKSGPTSIVGGITYSNKEGNIASVSGVSYSMIGETTPDGFYQSLTESMMSDGFLSRFTIIEYDGKRPDENPHQNMEPDSALLEHLRSLVAYSLDLQNRPAARVFVQRTDEAAQLLHTFNKECDHEINSTTDESKRQMWNRAHLKTLRIAALLAVADNPANPWITLEAAEWALMVVRKDIGMMQRRMTEGDVGVDDDSREKKVLSIIKDFLRDGAPPGYNINAGLQFAGIVPRKLIQLRTARLNSFYSHRMGATAAMDATIRALVDTGRLVEMDKTKVVTEFGAHGKCYRVLDLS